MQADNQTPVIDSSSAEFSAIDKIDTQAIKEETITETIPKNIPTIDSQNQTNTQEEKIELVLFKPKNENKLEAIINRLAELSGRNIILPQEGLSLEKVTVNFDYPEKMSIQDAWENFLPTILDIAGYSICKEDDLYVIIKNSKDIGKEPMPIYINTNNTHESIPDTDQRIRYIHYFTNIKILTIKDVLQALVQGLLPSDTIFETDPSTNSFILCAKANNIKGFIKIIEPLDIPGFQEEYDIIELRHADAKTVAAIFNDQILKSDQDRNRYRLDAKKESKETYFSDTIKIIPAERLRSLILLGKPQAIQKIKDVIKQYIDIPIDEAEPFIHTYQLQYLDAYDLKPVLDRVIESKKAGGTGQSRGQNSENGPERWFQEVIIYADSVKTKEHELKYPGTNTLIIAAQPDDWKQIKELIKKLDSPQPQVLIEILIADLTLNDARNLGSITRNPENFSLPGAINFQSAQFNGIITDSPVTLASKTGANANATIPTTIKSDLLGDTTLNSKTGTTLISLNDSDGKTWSLLQIINSFTDSKVLSHPHLITTNNQSASVRTGETRLLPDEASGSTGGAATQVFKSVSASLEITIKPRISADNLINLHIDIDVQDFATDNPIQGSRNTRHLKTNANVPDKTILPLGGIIQKSNRVSQNETPLLGRIPLIGWLFKNRSGNVTESHLTIFILPTIIKPRLRPGVSKYTNDYISMSQKYADEGNLFDGLKEPITHLFFQKSQNFEENINAFLAKDEFKANFNNHDNSQNNRQNNNQNSEQNSTETKSERNSIGTKTEKKRKHTSKQKKTHNNSDQDSTETNTETDTNTKADKKTRMKKRKISTYGGPSLKEMLKDSESPFKHTAPKN